MFITKITASHLVERAKLHFLESTRRADPVGRVKLLRADVVEALPTIFRRAATRLQELAIHSLRELHHFHQTIQMPGNKAASTATDNAAHVLKNIFAPLVIGDISVSITLIPKERGRIARRD